MRPPDASLRRQRVRRWAAEVGTVVVTGLVAWFLARLDVAGTALAVLAALAVVVGGRLLPDSDATDWPRLPAPERSGRRAEIYRLSWQLDGSRETIPAAVRRLSATIDAIRPTVSDPERVQLDALAARLADHPRDLPRFLTDLEHLVGQVESPETPRPHHDRWSSR